MLGSYMEDLRITPEEFEKSCSVASKKALNQFHQSLFQQVWAADDFEIFKRMMTQKNLELQLQALEFLTQKRGSVPNCMEPNNPAKDDEKAMDEIIKKAIEDVKESPDAESNKVTPADAALQEKMKLEAQKEKELLEQAMKQAVKESVQEKNSESPLKSVETITENKPVIENGKHEDSKEEPEEEINSEDPSSPTQTEENSEKPTEESNIGNPEDTNSFLANSKLSASDNLPSGDPNPPKTLPPLKTYDDRPWSEGDSTVYVQAQAAVSPLELERRQNYLRQQRDRILAMKRQERARRLSQNEEVIAQARPKSARAARKILREESTDVDPQTLAFRKSLAAKLRSEVIDKVD
ncbi:cilia- and flagella-associated protein 36-like isoform X2 [Stegodyphus dumicola]|nr:cilia- and flagella-associated protein 36-like isoform X2 [Stegodyphus dumicola]